MEGKGLIKFFMSLMLVVSAVQLLYFIPTRREERKAEEYAQTATAAVPEVQKTDALKKARAQYLDSISNETIFKIPMLANYSYNDLKRQQLNMGLDLKGGMSVLLEVDVKELLASLAGRNATDPDFQTAIANAQKAQSNSQANFVTVFVTEFKKIAPNKKLSRIFQGSEALGTVTIETSDGEIERMLRSKADQTVELTFKMLKERIDKLGVVQPNVSLDANRDLILVEMPGIDNPGRARKFLQASAQLEFWDTYRFTDSGISAGFMQADKILKGDTTAIVAVDTASLASDKGPLLSLLSLNGQGANFYPTVMGVADKTKRDAITAMLAKEEVKAVFPKGIQFFWSYKPTQDPTTREFSSQYELYAIKSSATSDKAPLEGDVITKASTTQDQNTGEPQVSLTMNAFGAKKWAEMTQRAYDGNAEGKQREIAIVLDDQVVTAPGLRNGPITGGSSVISGAFSTEEAVDLANILEVGKLPAKTKIIQESNVGPSLGEENINKSLMSLFLGFLLVLGFMTLYYAGGGIVSILALFFNILFIFGILSSFGTVLTLPGIAGIVLTIGMAVDANVIIYERIKEELRIGKSMLQAIQDGYKNSYSAIIDGNFTTLIVGFILTYFGLGPIKGFGVVLIVGILSTLFTAVLISRLMIDWWTKDKNRSMSFSHSWSANTFANMNFDWMSKRKYAYIFSGTIVVLGLISAFTRGFDLGVDFKGGHSYNIQLPRTSTVSLDKIAADLSTAFGTNTIVKRVDTDNTFNVVTSYKIEDSGDKAYEEVTTKLYEGLKVATGTQLTVEKFMSPDNTDELKLVSYSKVGPTIADDIKNSSWIAAIAALLLIFLYILVRFVKWQYSTGAVIATAHDAIVTLSLFSLLRGLVPWSLEIDQALIAAILTIIGYSVNDTVIVFDRIREYTKLYPNKPIDEVYNGAINSTFARTIFTSLNVLFVVIVLFIFGGASIKNFAFALLIGIGFGTYSSVFVATSIMRDLSTKFGKKA